MKNCAECPPRSALTLVLRISRFAGVAPVTFSPNGLRISRSLSLYNYIFVTIISVVILSGFALDLLTEPERSLRVRTPTSRVIWVSNLSIVILITSVAAYRAPARTECMIKCLNQIHKIKIFIGCGNKPDPYENIKIFLVIIICVGLWFLVFFDVYGYVIEAITRSLEVRTLLLYSFLYYEYYLLLLVQLQFVLIGLKLLSALQLVNDALKQLILTIDTQRKSDHCLYSVNIDLRNVLKTKLNNYVIKTGSTVPNKTLNLIIDSLAVSEKADWKQPFREENRTVRDLSIAYGAVCDVLRHIDEGHGLLLLLILVSFFLQLIITPYYLITALYTSTDRIGSLLLQISWCLYHIISMLMVVEPCYQMQKEMDKTQMLVCYLTRNVTPADPMSEDLDNFCKQLQLDRPTYTPLGMCTLSRPLTVTIIGAVTTYLVIIFQFRSYESDDKA